MGYEDRRAASEKNFQVEMLSYLFIFKSFVEIHVGKKEMAIAIESNASP